MSLLMISVLMPQGFNQPSRGFQVFNFKDTIGRNQVTFFSEAPYENITGLANNAWGKVSFDMKDIKNSLNAELQVAVSSLKTGIEKRDEHLLSISWLNSEKFPVITFKIKEILSFEIIEDNVIKLSVLGNFTLHGYTKMIFAYATMKYLAENEITKTIMPGDLLNLVAKFDINLSDFGINNTLIGNRVSDKILITANLVGSNTN
jgi:polyisoprenoid-binding protein YceI